MSATSSDKHGNPEGSQERTPRGPHPALIPDSLSGMVFACEGIRNTVTLLNGPTGCKYYHAEISSTQWERANGTDPLDRETIWYFGQSRVPCTYLDSRDYVYGSKGKLSDAIRDIEEKASPELLCVINTPGTALIGDSLSDIVREAAPDKEVLIIDSPGYSDNPWDGYAVACEAAVDLLCPKRTGRNQAGYARGSYVFGEGVRTSYHGYWHGGQKDRGSLDKRPRVNLLGMSIFQKQFEGDLAELKRCLELLGADVNCALCCDCTVEDIVNIGDADLDIVVDTAYGRSIARTLEDWPGIPYVEACGRPVGYSGMELLAGKVRRALQAQGKELAGWERFTEEMGRARARSYAYLTRLNSMTGFPENVPFAVVGSAAECLGYCSFLVDYFALRADSVKVLGAGEDDPDEKALSGFLREHGMEDALSRDILESRAQLVFADGDTLGRLKLEGHEFFGIETGLPTLGYTDVVPKTHLGIAGGLLLTELVINGMPF